jgi:hypothetical protein
VRGEIINLPVLVGHIGFFFLQTGHLSLHEFIERAEFLPSTKTGLCGASKRSTAYLTATGTYLSFLLASQPRSLIRCVGPCFKLGESSICEKRVWCGALVGDADKRGSARFDPQAN